MHILVVEPSSSWRALIKNILVPLKVVIKSCSSIEEATVLLSKTKKFDLVIIGSELDDGHAYELIVNLRSFPSAKFAPIYLITSSQNKSAHDAVLDGGVTEVFSKSAPDEFVKVVVSRVKNLLTNEHMQAEVLLIEDSLSQALMISEILFERDLVVTHFTSAEEALMTFNHASFDLIVSDIFLAGKMTGLTLLRRIRAMPGEKGRTPFLAISADEDTSRKIELFDAGTNDFVSKPVIEEELIARASNLIANKKLLDQVNEQREKLEQLAMIDQLTGVHNRNYVYEQAISKISEAIRHDWDCSLFVMDIDNFKLVNDVHGHPVGDFVLKSIGELLKKFFRNEDVIARFGGEEFVAILPHCSCEQAVSKAEAVRSEIESLKPYGLEVTASFGVTSIRHVKVDRPSFNDLYQSADKALYRAKQEGRNRVYGDSKTPVSDVATPIRQTV